MSEIHRVIRGNVQVPRAIARADPLAPKNIAQGQLIPPGLFSDQEIESWLQDGRIEVAGIPEDELADRQEASRARGKWQVDPAVLVGKSLEELGLKILSIDSSYDMDLIADEVDAVRLLTSDWDPRYRQTVPPASDRSRPAVLALGKLTQAGDVRAVESSYPELGPGASQAMAALRARAASMEAESSHGDPDSKTKPEASAQEG